MGCCSAVMAWDIKFCRRSLFFEIYVVIYSYDINRITFWIGVHFYLGKNVCPFSHTC